MVEHADCHRADVNCAPLSVVRCVGTPKRHTHVLIKASEHVAASMALRGKALIHLVDRSTHVKM
jgi:hypothetical protein